MGYPELVSMERKFEANRGFVQYVKAFVGLMVVAIIAVSVTIPTVQTAISDGAYTGTLATVLNIIPLMIAIVILMLVVGMLG